MLPQVRGATAAVPSAIVSELPEPVRQEVQRILDGAARRILREESAVPALANLKTLRTRAALSQRDLAKLAGVAHTTIVRLEGGDPNVLPSTLRKIARALKVKPSELIG
jgi:DNA-binding XRE family transcriptional regulator